LIAQAGNAVVEETTHPFAGVVGGQASGLGGTGQGSALTQEQNQPRPPGYASGQRSGALPAL